MSRCMLCPLSISGSELVLKNPAPEGWVQYCACANCSYRLGDLTGRWSVEATGFANFLSNLQVSATNGAGESLIGTAGTAHSRGMEATAHWKPLDTLQLNAFLGLTYAAYDRFVFGGSDYSGKQMAGTPRSNFGFSGEWHPVPGWTVNASAVRRGRTTLYPSSSIRNAPYVLVDAQIEKRWKHWTVALYGHNRHQAASV